MVEIYHTIPFLMDLLGLVLAMSLALTQVCWSNISKRKYVEHIRNEIFQMLTIAGNVERAFRSTSVAIVILMYLFLSNYMGQRVTDMSSSACEKVWVIYFFLNSKNLSKKSLKKLIIFHKLLVKFDFFFISFIMHY